MPSSMPRINWIEIQGFRAFGRKPQRVEFSSAICVLWGPNSQGKTSFAEAVEFLFTGTIVRKELLASAQDEFADSLRNTHLPSNQVVYVAAEVLDNNGSAHSMRRTLASDFSKRGSCTSTLEIDGRPASSDGFAKIGIVLSQPPMAVPILMQHTLGYLFTAKPQERSLYFKALLEVGDLDTLRNAIGQREATLQKADTNLLTKLRSAAAIDNQDVRNTLTPLLGADESPPAVVSAVSAALDFLLLHASFDPPEVLSKKIAYLETVLEQKQAKTFPLALFRREAFTRTIVESDALWTSLDAFRGQSQKVDAEVKQLAGLFTEVLKVPTVVANTGAIDCPVCGTEDALTQERVQLIRDRLRTSEAFVQAQDATQVELRQIDTGLIALERNSQRGRPSFRRLPRRERIETGFSVKRMRELLPAEQAQLLQPWLRELRSLLRAARRLSKAAAAVKAITQDDVGEFATAENSERLRASLADLQERQTSLIKAGDSYAGAEHGLREALRVVVDANSSTTGWQDLLDVAKDLQGIRSDLLDMKALAVVKGEFAKAIQKIDRAKEEVLNDKFAGMSDEIQAWWERLRPDEPVFFSGVKPRPLAVRTIDFKASLATSSERLNPHVRDVVAIFSVSQMHCLGLAAFLARSVREKCGFVILDDPIMSSDEDHRTNFLHGGLQALLNAGYQVILLTQDQSLRKTLSHLYAHLNVELFEITMAEPADGSEVNKTSDSITAMLARVKPFVGNAHLEIRKTACEKLRDVAERVCKEIAVNNRRQNGDLTAQITDYVGPKGTFESLISEAEPFLNDPSHPGKLKVIAQTLNPGKHDGDVPTKEALKQAYGDLGQFRKHYNLS